MPSIMNKIVYGLAAVLLLTSCKEEQNEDIVQQPNKDGSIETVLSVTHADSFDILTTTHKVWVKGNLSKTMITSDTLSALGMEKVEKNDKGPTERKKDYEIYITVK